MECMPSIRWTQTTPHILGVVAAALLLAAPRAHADEAITDASPSSPDAERRVQLVEGRTQELESHRSDSGTKDSGLIPGVLIGPRLSLGLPTPALGAEAQIFCYFGVAFDYGLIPRLNINGVTVQYDMWNVAARVYPWGKVFFVGAVYGHYGIEASATTAQGSGAVRASSSFIGPQIGARWVQPSGFFIGVDLAWAFPLGYSSEATPDPSGTTASIQATADRYLQHGIPLVGLVSVGWLF